MKLRLRLELFSLESRRLVELLFTKPFVARTLDTYAPDSRSSSRELKK